jgi:hypothetical protein
MSGMSNCLNINGVRSIQVVKHFDDDGNIFKTNIETSCKKSKQTLTNFFPRTIGLIRKVSV